MTVHDTTRPDRVAADGGTAWPSVPEFGAPAFPPLHAVVARPVVRDRWERLVTEIAIPAPAGAVWEALTDPAAVVDWLAACRGPWAAAGEDSMLDFEDGEFFWCHTATAEPPGTDTPGTLRYFWRWVGIGPAACVTWTVQPTDGATTVTVTEEAVNPPSDWRSWNGMGWPGILEQLAGYLRTRTSWRWPWRRMGPYVQAELAAPAFEAWEALTSSGAVKFWLQRAAGSLAPGDPMTVVMGDASGTVLLNVTRSVEAAQEFPSYLPYVEFELRRPSWERALGGRLWIEPAGLGGSLLEVFHCNWEGLQLQDPLEERRILTAFWVSAARRAQSMFLARPPSGPPSGPHGWSS